MAKDEDMDGMGMSPLQEASLQLHELYSSLRDAGFSRGEALTLVGKVLAEGASDGN